MQNHQGHKSLPCTHLHVVRMIAALFQHSPLLPFSSFQSPADAAVFGTDERTTPRPVHDAALREKIGTLTSTDNGSFCTAFCVAPDMIATASHCLFGTAATPGPKLRALRFKLAESTLFDAGTAIAGRAIANKASRDFRHNTPQIGGYAAHRCRRRLGRGATRTACL